MGFGIEGKRLRLVPLDPDRHLENSYRWVNDPVVTRGLCIGAFPLTRIIEKDWIEKTARGSDTNVVFAIELIEDGRHIGNSGIHGISWVNRTATTGTVIGEKDLWGQGYGKEQAILRAGYCFNTLNLRVLYSEFMEGNEGSKRMQLAAGAEIWGVKPKAVYKNGEYLDVVQTVLTRERFEAFGSKTPTEGATES